MILPVDGLSRTDSMGLLIDLQSARAFLDHTNGWEIWQANDGSLIYVSPACEQISGYSVAEFLGNPRLLADIIHPEDRALYAQHISSPLERDADQLEFRILCKDGETRWIGHTCAAVYGPNREFLGRHLSNHDITRQKRAQDALRESEDKFKYIFERSPIGKSITQPNGRINVNRAFCEMLGYAPQELENMKWQDITPREDIPLTERQLAPLYAGQQDSARFLKRYVHKNGSMVWVDLSTSLRRNMDGEPVYFITSVIDITRQKQAEEQMTRSEAELRTLFSAMQDVVLVIDREGVYRKIAPTNPRLLYRPSQELLGKSLVDVFPPEQAKQFLESTRLAISENRTERIEYELMIDGQRSWFQTYITPMDAENTVWVARDITDRKNAERTLLRQVQELMVLQQVSAVCAQAVSEDELIAQITPIIGDTFYPDYFGVLMVDEEKKAFVTHPSFHISKSGVSFPGFIPLTAGISGQVYAYGTPVNCRDACLDPNYFAFSSDMRSDLCVPIKKGSKVLGVIHAESSRVGFFEPEDERLMTMIGEQMGVAIEHIRTQARLEKQLERLTALRKIDKAILTSSNLGVTLGVLLDVVLRLQDVDAADILLVSPGTDMLTFAAGKGFQTSGIEKTILRKHESLAGQALETDAAVFIPDLSADTAKFVHPTLMKAEGFQAYIGVPLWAKNRVLGVFEIYCRRPLTRNMEWIHFLESLAGQASIAIDNAHAFENLTQLNLDLIHSYNATIEGWGNALEYRDDETEGHSKRVTELSVRLATKCGFTGEDLVSFRRGALLHDIGKIGIPDSILRKPGPLNEEEWAIMRRHPLYSEKMLRGIPFLKKSLDIPLHHHEKWDGSGYPRGLKGEEIPLSARIFAIADVYDALTSDRPYRSALSKDKALGYIREQAGAHFDPVLVQVFLTMEEIK